MRFYLFLFLLIPSLTLGEIIDREFFEDWKYYEYQDVITDKIDSSISSSDYKNNRSSELKLWGGGSKSTSFIKSMDLTDLRSVMCTKGTFVNTILRVDKNDPIEAIFYLSEYDTISKKIGRKDIELINQFINGNTVILRISDDKCVLKDDYFFSLKGFKNSIQKVSSMYLADWDKNIKKCIKVQNAEIRYYDFNVIQFEMINECFKIYDELLKVNLIDNGKIIDSYDLEKLKLLPENTYLLSTDFKEDLDYKEEVQLEILYGGVQIPTLSKVLN